LGANLVKRTAPSGAVKIIANTDTTNIIFERSILSSELSSFLARSSATGPSAAYKQWIILKKELNSLLSRLQVKITCTVALGKPAIVT